MVNLMKLEFVKDKTDIIINDFIFYTLASVYFIIKFQSFIIT